MKRAAAFLAAWAVSLAAGGRPPAPPPPAPAPGVILIGWDGADWELLDDLVARGQMKNLARLLHEGRSAVLESYEPTVSPMVWTTIATGARPEDHGVLDFFEVESRTGRYVPVSVRSRRVPALWDLASEAGIRVGVLNWWATDPAARVDGFLVSDRACPALLDPDASRLPSAVYPPRFADGVRQILAAHPVPGAGELSRYGDFSRSASREEARVLFSRVVRSAIVTQETGVRLFEKESPRLLALYVLGTDEVGHLFGRFAPPRLPCVSEAQARAFGDVPARFYSLVDEQLGVWMDEAARHHDTLLLVSDHGFKWGARRSCGGNPLLRKSATFDHRLDGILAAWGDRVIPSERRGKASVFDVAPTVAALLGIPIDSRAPGSVLPGWFRGAPRLRKVAGLWAKTPPPRLLAQKPAPTANEYAERLRSLGYLQGSLPERAAVVPAGSRPGVTETGELNLGVWLDGQGDRAGARAAFERALRLRPGYPPAVFDLVTGELRGGDPRAALSAARRLFAETGPTSGWGAYQIADAFEQAGRAKEEELFLEEAARRLPHEEPVAVSLAGLRLEQKRCAEALAIVEPYLPSSTLPDTFNVAGFACDCLGRNADARRYLEKSLALSPDQEAVRRFLSTR